MSIVEELRSKVSRDNRTLLDRAAAEIDELTADNAKLRERCGNQRDEIRRLRSHVRSLEQSRDNWKGKAERVGKQLFEELERRKNGEN